MQFVQHQVTKGGTPAVDKVTFPSAHKHQFQHHIVGQQDVGGIGLVGTLLFEGFLAGVLGKAHRHLASGTLLVLLSEALQGPFL